MPTDLPYKSLHDVAHESQYDDRPSRRPPPPWGGLPRRWWLSCLLLPVLLAALPLASAVPGAGWAGLRSAAAAELPSGLYARIETARGNLVARLFYQHAPMTVGNFVGLAEGSMPWRDPKSGTIRKGPFFDGLVFHRVVKDFVIQGGDPTGTGSGGPGYVFPDEIVPQLRHDKAGILSMANAGPDTNGSQFFVTFKATPWLDGRHAVFGEIVAGQDVVARIRAGDAMRRVRILRIGSSAKAFDALNAIRAKLRQIMPAAR